MWSDTFLFKCQTYGLIFAWSILFNLRSEKSLSSKGYHLDSVTISLMEDGPTNSRRRKDLFSAILGLVAVVLLWRAIWDMTAAVMTPMMSLIVGLVLLGIIGYSNKEYLRKLLE